MGKQTTQTQDNDQKQDEIIDTTEDDKSTATAVKTSEEFDKKLDDEGIDESLSEDDEQAKDSGDKKDDSESDDTGGDDEDSGKTETEDEEAQTGDEDVLDQDLVDQAIELGFKTEEIALHKNNDELERTIQIFANIRPSKIRQEQTQTPAEKADTEKKDEGTIEFEDEEDIDPGILKAVRELEKQNKDLRQIVERVTGDIQLRQQQEFENGFDKMIEELGTDYEDVFGSGKGSEINQVSSAFRNRKAMIKRMHSIAAGYNAAKERIPSDQELFDQALYSLHKNKMSKVRSKKLSEKGQLQKGKKAGIPASSRTQKPATGLEKAIATSRKFDELIDTSE